MRVPQSIGMTIMKKFTNKQIVKFHWCEKSLSEQLDIIDSTRIMVYKGMVYKGKYSISEKNKGMPVSICPYF